jgi:gliding motility-associated-like protein
MMFFTRRIIPFLLFILISAFAKAQTADFRADNTAGCAPLVVNFTNTSTGAVSYYWDLGNGTTSVLTNPSGTYITAGTFTVTLTATSSSGSTSVRTMTITVYPSPTVSFYATDTSVCPGSPVTFVSTSTPGVSGAVTYNWNYGDGNSGTGASPTHTYRTPGNYNVTLLVTNSMGCSSTRTLSRYMTVFTKPTASFSAPITNFCNPPATVRFTNASSGTGTLSSQWDFGDGSAGSTASSPTYTYSGAGTYSVRLIVTDANGCLDTAIRSSYVRVVTTSTSFTSVSTACVNTLVTFYNTSSSSRISSNWDFGDRGASAADTGVHMYTRAGTYSVRLIIFTGFCYDTVVRSITITPAPTGTMAITPAAPCPAPATESFVASVASGISVGWEYGDGGSGSGTSTSHTYAANGVYQVKMVLTDASGCVDTIRRTFTINDLDFNINPDIDRGCPPLSVTFFSSVSTTIPSYGSYPHMTGATYRWDFRDGSGTVISTRPTHTFTAPGVYYVRCTLTTGNGCVTIDSVPIYVGRPPHATFVASPLRVCLRDSVAFVATVDTGVVDNFRWDFGDGSVRTGDTISRIKHRFRYPGVFTVTLTPSYRGCDGRPFLATRTIIVDSPLAAGVTGSLCTPRTLYSFKSESWGATSLVWILSDGYISTADTFAHDFRALGTYTATLATYNSRSGCRDTATFTIPIIRPTPRLMASDTQFCAGSIITLSPAPGSDTMFGYWWMVNGIYDLDDTDLDPVFTDTFNTPGRVSITMFYWYTQWCVDTLQMTDWLTVGKPFDSIVTTTPTGCGPFTASFVDRSSAAAGTSLSSYRWLWGDGTSTTVTSRTASHTYTAAGTYTVTSVAADNLGCLDTSNTPAIVRVFRPRASFAASTGFPCINAPVTFTNTSAGITRSFWLFGDGDTSSVSSPSHAYRANGSYTVRLIVWDSNGCTDTATVVAYIRVTSPVASFLMSDSFTICPPINVTFTNTTTGATSYSWDLGTATSVATSPSNLYTTAGLYTVTLVATNTYGCRDTARRTMIVYGYAGAFRYTPLTGCAPLLVRFSASLSNVPNIVWDFADGNVAAASRSDTISHYYTLPGAYVPKLILSDNTGCQASSVGLDTIKVNQVTPGFRTDPNPVCIHSTVSFVDTSKSYFSSVTYRRWTFAPTDTTNVASPVKRYDTLGTYPVTIYVVDGWGCTASITQNVLVNPPPNIVAMRDTVVCVGDTAWLRATGGVSYTWSGPAVTCATCDPGTANPTVVSTYTVVGTDINGCTNTDTVMVGMRTHTISGAWGDSEVCLYTPVQLNDTGGTKYTWIPASGLSNPRIANPVATPTVTTRYMVIAQLAGCIPDTNYVNVIIHQLPTVDAGPDQTAVAGSVVTLDAAATLARTYQWMPNENVYCDSCATARATMMQSTTFTVTVTSDYGCKAYDTLRVMVFCDEKQIFVPNTFTPNGDGMNDVFYPRGGGVSVVKTFRIFNRWGEMVFERTNFELNDKGNAWDGSYKGGEPRADVYVYLLEATCGTGAPLFLKGDVTVIK